MVWLLNAGLIASLCGLALGFATPISSLLSCGFMLAVNSVQYGYGKIGHDILPVLAPLFMAFSGWGDAYSVDNKLGIRYPGRAWCQALFAVVIGMAMITAAWPKLSTGWMRLDGSAVHGEVVNYYFGYGSKAKLAPVLMASTPGIAWEFLDWATVGIELAFIVACIKRRWFQVTCAVACLFHLGILLSMDLCHPYNVIAYSAFFPMATAVRRAQWWLPLSMLLALIVCPWHGFQEFVGQAIIFTGAILAAAWLVRRETKGL